MADPGMDRAVELLQGLAASGGEVARRHLALETLDIGNAPDRVSAVDGGSRLLYDLPGVIIGAYRVCATRLEGGHFSDDRGEVSVVALQKGDEGSGQGDAAGRGEDSATTAIGLKRSSGEWERTLEALRDARKGDVVLVDGCLDPPEAACRSFASEALSLARQNGAALVGISKRSELAVEGLPALPLASWLGRSAMPSVAWTCVLPSQSSSFETYAVKFLGTSRFVFRADVASENPTGTLASLATLCNDAGYPGYPYPLARVHNLAAMDQTLCDDLRSKLDESVRRSGGDDFWRILKDDFHSVLDGGVR